MLGPTLDPWRPTLDPWKPTLEPWRLTLELWGLTPNPGGLEAHTGAVEAHPGAVEGTGGSLEALEDVSSSNCFLNTETVRNVAQGLYLWTIERKIFYCPKLGAASLISDNKFFFKKGPKRPKNVIFYNLGP